MDSFFNSPAAISIEGFLLRDFPPAKDVQEADIFLDTLEVFEKIATAFPGNYSLEDISLLLEQLDYQRQSVGQMKLVWLIKKSSNA